MRGEDIVNALGKPFEHADVQKLISELGITKIPKAKRDDPDSGIEVKKHGVSVSFIDADYLADKRVARYGNADMIFYQTVLYTLNGEPGYKAYQGSLPKGASLSDTKDQLIAKLGAPTDVYEKEGKLRAMTWQFDDVWLTFNYRDHEELKYLGVVLPSYMKLMQSKSKVRG